MQQGAKIATAPAKNAARMPPVANSSVPISRP